MSRSRARRSAYSGLTEREYQRYYRHREFGMKRAGMAAAAAGDGAAGIVRHAVEVAPLAGELGAGGGGMHGDCCALKRCCPPCLGVTVRVLDRQSQTERSRR
eukprot:6192663-Pleurochrysis_carterae.AAC.1